jgi:hypothetical protein
LQPDVLAREIIEDVEAALELSKTIAGDLDDAKEMKETRGK